MLIDTSALVGALLADHPQHQWVKDHVRHAARKAISTHTLAEAFKVLTVYPRQSISAENARVTLMVATANMQKVSLDDSDYFAVMERCTAEGLSGSVIFDALIAHAALKARADKLLTLNPKDFKRLGADVAGILIHP